MHNSAIKRSLKIKIWFQKYLSLIVLGLLLTFALKPESFVFDDGLYTWNQVVFGSRMIMTSILIGFVVAGLIPIPIGILFGYFKEWRRVKKTMYWIWDAMEIFPLILIAIIADFLFQKDYRFVVPVISFFLIPRFSRVIEGMAGNIRDREFIQIAKLNGLSNLKIIQTHLLPLLKNAIISNIASCIATVMLMLTAIGFLDLALLPGKNNWGHILRGHIPGQLSEFANLDFTLPALFIIVIIFSLFWTSEYYKETGDLEKP
jgi:ABC-type dipeptide/oligopeptide/nickel transport system permease subunit